MIKITIPGYKKLFLEHLVLDYNGTIACDGKLIDGVMAVLNELSSQVKIHILTADTFGNVKGEIPDVSCTLSILPLENQDEEKLKYIKKLGSDSTVCIGNGRNDRLMLKAAALGISVIQEEGAAVEAITAADVVSPNILDALHLLSHPLRLIATLRS